MTTDPTPDPMPGPADYRRACALMVHHATEDMAGMIAVLEEATDAKRGLSLTLALLTVFEQLNSIAFTPAGLALVHDTIRRASVVEGQQ